MAPVCDTVTVEDISESSIGIGSVSASGGELVGQVTFEVSNTIEEGDGKPLSETVSVTVNGTEEYSEEVETSPGENVEMSVTLESLNPGDYEVCANISSGGNCDTMTVTEEQSDGGEGGNGEPDGGDNGDNGGGGSEDPSKPDQGDEGSGMGSLLVGAAGLGIGGYILSRGDGVDQ